jgi:hypothetical protein
MNKDYRLRRTILAAMNSVGDAELREIATALGPDWLKPKKLTSLRQMLRIMEREGLVMRMRVGVFRALSGGGWGGLGSSEEIIRCISACLHECGGVVRVEDVLDDCTDQRIWGPDERVAQSRYICQIVREATCFRQEGEFVSLSPNALWAACGCPSDLRSIPPSPANKSEADR